MLVKPIKASVFLEYECPECQSTLQFSVEEIAYTQRALCYCGTKLEFGEVNVEVICTYGKKYNPVPKELVKGKLQAAPNNSVDSNKYESVIISLVNLGYKKPMAKSIVEKVARPGDTEEALLQKCLMEKVNA
jgi:hypothetical protein